MSTSQEVNDFMESVIHPTQIEPVEQAQPPIQESSQPPVQQPDQPQQQAEAPTQESVVTSGVPQVDGASTETTAPAAKTPEQMEIERLRSEIGRLTVDHQVASFEDNLKKTTEQYLSNKNTSIEAAHRRNRELIDAGEPEKADQELRAFYAKVEAADNNMRNYVQTQRSEFAKQREHIDLAPKYAQHLGQVHGLSAEDVALLSKFDGFVQDRMIGDIVARNRNVKSNEARLRDLEASVRAQSGAFAPGGTTGSAAPPTNQRPSDPMEAEVWDYMQSPIVSIGGQ